MLPEAAATRHLLLPDEDRWIRSDQENDPDPVDPVFVEWIEALEARLMSLMKARQPGSSFARPVVRSAQWMVPA